MALSVIFAVLFFFLTISKLSVTVEVRRTQFLFFSTYFEDLISDR
jgi:hypothetical protein